MRKLFTALFMAGVICTSLKAQDISSEKLIYKKVDTTSLALTVYFPEDHNAAKPQPAIIFFFGGGWIGGSIEQFRPQAEYFAKRGLVSILAEYRIENEHGTSPFEALKDSKSAVRYVRKNAAELHIDPDKIIVSGGSAGGHLAAACGLNGFDEAGEDLSISAKPNALVLFNPVVDNGPGGYGYSRIGDRYHEFSPIYNIKKGAPPTIIFLGTEDQLIPVETIKYYQVVMEKVGSRCEIFLYEGQKHAFYNKDRSKAYFKETLLEVDKFLTSLGYLSGEPTITLY